LGETAFQRRFQREQIVGKRASPDGLFKEAGTHDDKEKIPVDGVCRQTFERDLRNPIPVDVQLNFPQRCGAGLKTHIILSPDMRDQVEAKRLLRQKIVEIEGKFYKLRDTVKVVAVKRDHALAWVRYMAAADAI